jgi:hypothetical protein
MNPLWILLTTLLIVARCELIFVESDIAFGHRFAERATYKGEFPCLNASLHGRRKFFEFVLTICNDEAHQLRLPEDERVLQVSLQALNGTVIPDTLTNITLPYLRDSVCKDRIMYTRGDRYTLGGHCCCQYPVGIPCMWIDITNLTLPDYFLFSLSLSDLTPTSVSLCYAQLEEQFEKVDSNRINGFVFVLAIAALVIVFVPYGKSKLRIRTTPL